MTTHAKLMTITRAEFERSLAALTPGAVLDHDGWATIAADGGAARIRFEELPRRRIGGLIALPQARVTIDLAGLPDAERSGFLRRFDVAFQRGGG